MLFMYVSAIVASSNIAHVHIHSITNLLCCFCITLNMNLPNFFTIKKNLIFDNFLLVVAAALK